MKKTLSGVMFLAAVALSAEVVTFNTPADWRRSKDFIPVENGALQIKTSNHLSARKSIPVDPEKSYKLSMKIRRAPGSAKEPQVYLTAVPFNEEGRTIHMQHVTPLKGSDAVLTADCTKESTELLVKPENERYWAPIKSWRVQFNAAKDFSDLPNFAVSNNISKIDKMGDGVIKVTLRGPAGIEGKAGTPVRITQGGAYMYLASIKPTEQWQDVTATVKGVSDMGWSNTVFPAGTCTFAPALLANWGSSGSVFEIKDFTVEEL
ncbi:MAG: hypothetical protein J6S43_04695 [Lentisphaeria bacterium]|nr:hypothetical protein [Lentisphaeria bacterium]